MYANIVVDISVGQLDRTFQYLVPPHLEDQVQVGVPVYIPFGNGNRQIKGYVVELTTELEYEGHQMKEIQAVITSELAVEDQMVRLAAWMKQRYGSTFNQCLKTVMPVKDRVKGIQKRYYYLSEDRELVERILQEARGRKNYHARVRVLEALLEQDGQAEEQLTGRLGVSKQTLQSLVTAGALVQQSERQYRNPTVLQGEQSRPLVLNEQQQAVADAINEHMDRLYGLAERMEQSVAACSMEDRTGRRQGTGGLSNRMNLDKTAALGSVESSELEVYQKPCLIHGITGSGKTEVYMELIAHALSQGRQAIVLIPEIALTYQTVMRFYRRFGERVATIHSRLSDGERYDQFQRARKGLAQVMIGPRSALFTPFPNLGLIIIDEEHEGAYKSETMPRYHAREVARKRADMAGALLVLGSATPSMEAYYRTEIGDYVRYELTRRGVASSTLAATHIVDLRKELEEGNRSIFSRKLHKMMEERLERGEQTLLFLNRRGYASVVSCRSCGEPIKCPHCDVSLTAHLGWRLNCHYCGYSIPMPKACPSCHSPYISSFGLGTEKVQLLIEKQFPGVRTLRMDMDTTSKKEGHQEILSRFAAGEADVLIGTQMIVKGHDFPNVTLMGILAADMSLHASNYLASERTFQLLTQAAGRAGRGSKPGDVVIQTYSPEHYSITCAASQDYRAFYEEELKFRQLMHYPPVMGMLAVLVSSPEEALAEEAIQADSRMIAEGYPGLPQIGPTPAPVSKMKDIYRKLLYVKCEEYDILIEVKQRIEALHQEVFGDRVMLAFDLCE